MSVYIYNAIADTIVDTIWLTWINIVMTTNWIQADPIPRKPLDPPPRPPRPPTPKPPPAPPKPPKPKPPTIRVSWRYNKNQEWVGDLGWSTTDATSLTINGNSVNVNGGWRQYRLKKGKRLYFSARGPGGYTSYEFIG